MQLIIVLALELLMIHFTYNAGKTERFRTINMVCTQPRSKSAYF